MQNSEFGTMMINDWLCAYLLQVLKEDTCMPPNGVARFRAVTHESWTRYKSYCDFEYILQ